MIDKIIVKFLAKNDALLEKTECSPSKQFISPETTLYDKKLYFEFAQVIGTILYVIYKEK